jgi:hypothetical protein
MKFIQFLLLMLLLMFSGAAFGKIVYHLFDTIDGEDYFDRCNNETILLYGEYSLKISEVEPKGKVISKIKYNLHTTGVGVDTSNIYTYNESVHTSLSGVDWENYSQETEGFARFISEGSAPNLKARSTLLIEFEDGEMVARHFISEIECAGKFDDSD